MKNWTIIYTSDKNGKFFHEEYFFKKKTSCEIILADMSNDHPKHFAWFNCDLLFRDWLRSNIDRISNNNVYVCEYDVLTKTKLPSIKLENQLYVSKALSEDEKTKWRWKDQISWLGQFKKYAYVIIPFGWLMCSRGCLVNFLHPKFDILFQRTIISELRFGTIMNYNKVKIQEYGLKYITPCIRDMPKTFSKEDFYHPVKRNV